MGEESRKRLFDEYKSKSIAPLDIYLGIEKLPFKISPNLMLQMAFWCQNQGSYQAAEDMIRATLGLTVNDDTMRMVTNYVGKLVFDRDKEKAAKARLMLEKGINIPKYRKNDAKSILYIEMDGSAVNTRIKANGSSWKENKLGCVFSSDNIHYYTNSKTGEKEHRIEKCEYVSYLGSASEFKWHLFALALENNYDPEREVVILSDGAAWIRNLSEELFPGATMILDLFHLFENVHTYAKGLFPEDSVKANSWAKPVCEKLEEGKWKEVLEKDVEDKTVLGFNLHSYIETNSDRIDYPTYKRKGYFVGSGAIKSGNKAVVQKRLKLAGMRWNTESAQYLLTLRAKYSSGRWVSDVEAAVGSLFSITPEVLKIPKK